MEPVVERLVGMVLGEALGRGTTRLGFGGRLPGWALMLLPFALQFLPFPLGPLAALLHFLLEMRQYRGHDLVVISLDLRMNGQSRRMYRSGRPNARFGNTDAGGLDPDELMTR